MYEHLSIKDAPGKGKGVFATCKLTPADRIYGVTDFALSAISTPQLTEFCYHCYAGSHPPQDWYSVGQYRDATLKRCSGCNIAHFCSKWCQTQSWKQYHKYECKIFAELQPNILPEAVRAVIRSALQHKNDKLPQGAWQSILSLSSHHQELQAAGGDTWTNLMLMAKAAHKYSEEAAEDFVFLKLLCVLKINAITLQTTYNDPIGMMLDPFVSTMNHSCDANVAIHRSTYTNSTGWLEKKQEGQVGLVVMLLRDVAPGEELTITYIDFQQHVHERRKVLREGYCFNCTCSKCIFDTKAEESLRASHPEVANQQAEWRKRADDQFQQLTKPPFMQEVISKAISKLTDIVSGMEKSPHFSPVTDPYNRAIQELKLLHMSDHQACDLAFINGMKQYLIVGPQLYSSPIHPTRIVTALYILKIMALFEDTYNSEYGHGLNIEPQRRNLESKGLTRQNLAHWRVRISVDMTEILAKCVMQDLRECFIYEQRGIGISDRSAFERLLTDVTIKENAEHSMKQLLGISDSIWSDAKRSWSKMRS